MLSTHTVLSTEEQEKNVIMLLGLVANIKRALCLQLESTPESLAGFFRQLEELIKDPLLTQEEQTKTIIALILKNELELENEVSCRTIISLCAIYVNLFDISDTLSHHPELHSFIEKPLNSITESIANFDEFKLKLDSLQLEEDDAHPDITDIIKNTDTHLKMIARTSFDALSILKKKSA